MYTCSWSKDSNKQLGYTNKPLTLVYNSTKFRRMTNNPYPTKTCMHIGWQTLNIQSHLSLVWPYAQNQEVEGRKRSKDLHRVRQTLHTN